MSTSCSVQIPRIIAFKSPQLRIILLLNKYRILPLSSKEQFIRLHWFKEMKMILKLKWTIYYRNLINKPSKEKIRIWMKSFLRQILSHLESKKVNLTNIIQPLWLQFNIPFNSWLIFYSSNYINSEQIYLAKYLSQSIHFSLENYYYHQVKFISFMFYVFQQSKQTFQIRILSF